MKTMLMLLVALGTIASTPGLIQCSWHQPQVPENTNRIAMCAIGQEAIFIDGEGRTYKNVKRRSL